MSEKKISSGAEKAEKLTAKSGTKKPAAKKNSTKAVQHGAEMQEKKSEQIKLEPREERKLEAAKSKDEK